ncbi:MAG: hypothetical protein ACPGES_04880 [Coraliomargarita sp.]
MSEYLRRGSAQNTLAEKLRDETLITHLRSEGKSKLGALEQFMDLAKGDSIKVAEQEVKGTYYSARWVRRYRSAGDTIKTILKLPLMLVPFLPIKVAHYQEMHFETVHRMHEEQVRDFWIHRFLGALLQAAAVAFTLCSILFCFSSASMTFVEYGALWGWTSVVLSAAWLWLVGRCYKWTRRYTIPSPLRAYSANGEFEYRGLKKRDD